MLNSHARSPTATYNGTCRYHARSLPKCRLYTTSWLVHTSLDALRTSARGSLVPLECMALTSAVANAAAAAAAAGAGKKAAQVQLQAELNTDEEWNKFLTRDGLLGESNIIACWVFKCTRKSTSKLNSINRYLISL